MKPLLGLAGEQTVFLITPASGLTALHEWQQDDTAALSADEINREIAGDLAKKAARVAEILELPARRCAHEHLLCQIARVLAPDLAPEIGNHPGTFAAIGRATSSSARWSITPSKRVFPATRRLRARGGTVRS